MINEERNERNDGYLKFRSTMHVAMGIVYILLGVVVLYVKYFGAMELSAGLAYAIGGLMMAYGAFRLWRGITDMKLRNRARR